MKWVLLFTVGYTAAMFAYGRSVDSPLTMLYTGITVGLLVLFTGLHRWARFSTATLWVASFVGLGNMLGGVLLVDGEPLYLAAIFGSVRYDKLFHALAAFGMTFLAWEATQRWAGSNFHRGGMLLLTWLVVMGGGAVVEIAELIGSIATETNVGDYRNNAFDLVANGAGGLAGIFFVARWK